MLFLKNEKNQLFKSHEWPRHNLSLQYQHNINQVRDDDKEKISIWG